jgi:hypothetical protein
MKDLALRHVYVYTGRYEVGGGWYKQSGPRHGEQAEIMSEGSLVKMRLALPLTGRLARRRPSPPGSHRKKNLSPICFCRFSCDIGGNKLSFPLNRPYPTPSAVPNLNHWLVPVILPFA